MRRLTRIVPDAKSIDVDNWPTICGKCGAPIDQGSPEHICPPTLVDAIMRLACAVEKLGRDVAILTDEIEGGAEGDAGVNAFLERIAVALERR